MDTKLQTLATTPGLILGTLSYIAPEQLETFETDGGQEVAPDDESDRVVVVDLDSRGDVYSLGVVLFELLCERRPYLTTTVGALVSAIQTQAPPWPSSIVPALRGNLDAIVLKALSRERDARYGSAEALAADVRAQAAGCPTSKMASWTTT